MQPVIRALSPSDFDRWLVLWKAYQVFYRAAIPDEVTRGSFNRMLDPAEPMFGALATDGPYALGLVHWIFHRSNWTAGDYCYLQDLYVHADHRGAGLGRALINHVYTEADAAGCSRVYWLTQETNTTAMRLYDAVAERTGFIQYKKPIPAHQDAKERSLLGSMTNQSKDPQGDLSPTNLEWDAQSSRRHSD